MVVFRIYNFPNGPGILCQGGDGYVHRNGDLARRLKIVFAPGF